MTDAASILSAIRPSFEYSNDDIALPIFFLRTLFALRLLPRRRVLSQLRAFAQQQLHAARIAGCTGSLTDVALRYAGQENTALLSGKFEVIALNGTCWNRVVNIFISAFPIHTARCLAVI